MASFRCARALALLLVLCGAWQAAATVTLSIRWYDGSPGFTATSSTTSLPGGQFKVQVFITADNNEQVTGIDYRLLATGPAAGQVRLLDRILTETAVGNIPAFQTDVPDLLISSDSQVEYPTATGDTAILKPNGFNLGGSIQNVNTPLSGTIQVARYTLGFVDNSTPVGNYAITVDPASSRWVDSEFNTIPFGSVQAFTVQVPEPGGLLLAGAALLCVARRRRTVA